MNFLQIQLLLTFYVLFIGFFFLIYQMSQIYLNHQKPHYIDGWPPNIPRNLSLYINLQKNTTILHPNDYCGSKNYLYIIVCTAPNNKEARNSIRETWANEKQLTLLNYFIKVHFLIGQTNSLIIQKSIERESSEFNDIIQENFYDSYNNLTIKVGMLLKWINNHCQDTKYVMKIDDDIFLNIPMLLDKLKLQKNSDFLLGEIQYEPPIIRIPSEKWYMPEYMYPRDYYYDRYPSFVSGCSYVMTLNTTKKILNTALTIEFLYLEDVFFNGVELIFDPTLM
ncbi:lactosylceramide 1,3-N-acetyl-beta-D-glucosaminyltransferase-like [Aphidius gifuensis]|uniref:lactosylceramide 1,3-N-acetyl-beta-D-glucosaminyltransferase-like n=1 Tax=Aphidius gifuensis TaxID=684658 RepID=UPI001CDBEA6E|nr:lactosylceramide 1,3-N-acetyl-beta-D-glucosaminyltransferase-like [Aphidius gifuensis]